MSEMFTPFQTFQSDINFCKKKILVCVLIYVGILYKMWIHMSQDRIYDFMLFPDNICLSAVLVDSNSDREILMMFK